MKTHCYYKAKSGFTISELLPAPDLGGLPTVIDRVPFRIPIAPVGGALRYRTQIAHVKVRPDHDRRAARRNEDEADDSLQQNEAGACDHGDDSSGQKRGRD